MHRSHSGNRSTCRLSPPGAHKSLHTTAPFTAATPWTLFGSVVDGGARSAIDARRRHRCSAGMHLGQNGAPAGGAGAAGLLPVLAG